MDDSSRVSRGSRIVRTLSLVALVGASAHLYSETTKNNVPTQVVAQEDFSQEYFIGGSRDAETFTLTFDADAVNRLLATPRNAFSQYDSERFTQQSDVVGDIADLIFQADQSNFSAWLGVTPANGEPAYIYSLDFIHEDYARVLDFIAANINYETDPGFGYAQFPEETLVKKKGDCEDMAYLAAALLEGKRRVGIWYEKVTNSQTGEATGHATLAIEYTPGTILPQRFIDRDGNEMDEYHRLVEAGELDESTTYMEYQNLLRGEFRYIYEEEESPVLIRYGDMTFFLVETTGGAYTIKSEVGEMIDFHLIE